MNLQENRYAEFQFYLNPGAKIDLKFKKIVENDDMSLQKEEGKFTSLM